MKEPYIGITGFTRLDEINDIAGHAKNAPHQVMFGFISSQKRLANPTEPGSRSPALVDLPGLVGRVPSHILPMIHYYSPRHETTAEEVGRVFNLLYETQCRAVQLNQAWPLPKQIEQMRKNIDGLEVVLQMPKAALEEMGKIANVAERAREYDGLVEYVLIDPSGGTGENFETKHTISLLHVFSQELPNARLGYAGGLSADNVEERTRLIRTISGPASIDAESKLRRTDSNKLHIQNCVKYMQNAKN